ncbi:MAG: peptide chain release factor N(5)-glutamine methyltransferase [Gammaproteobacteria bacterium]|nr:peptide chain release factor N(5)-glutamine methyltransferase [Gammaproteobacteria bacterium]
MPSADNELKSRNLRDILEQARLFLAGSESAHLDAELLLMAVLGKNRAFLRTWPDYPVERAQRDAYCELLERRKAGEPVAYLLGQWEFWSLPLQVNTHTLVPRPETELLVEQALARLPDGSLRVADLGTGSGAIALALASERPSWNIWASDLSEKALEVARTNARQLKLPNVTFCQGNWCEALPEQSFNMIVSNPPYIAPDDPYLEGDGLPFEPISALVAGNNGLKDIISIVQQASLKLIDGGWLLIEHGAEQGASVRDIYSSAKFQCVETKRDFAGNERLSLGKLKHAK